MSRQPIPFHTEDVSALARALKAELAKFVEPPGHVELLNVLARATGFRNFQHLRAQAEACRRLENPAPPPAAAPVDFIKVARIARYFDPAGRLMRWPSKHSHRLPCLWVLWSRLAPTRIWSEAEISRDLQAQHDFGDPALLRRELCDQGLMVRTPDGREYRRIATAPPEEALALIRHLKARMAA